MAENTTTDTAKQSPKENGPSSHWFNQLVAENQKLPGRVLIGFLIAIVLIFSLPYLFLHKSWLPLGLSTDKIGTAIGGIMGPFIAIVAAGLTFMAFWVQYIANLRQRQDIQRERLERKFYQLVEYHKQNVNSLNLSRSHGADCWPQLVAEFKATFYLFKSKNTKFSRRDGWVNLTDDELIKLSYKFFFLGTRIINEENFQNYFDDKQILPLIEEVHYDIVGDRQHPITNSGIQRQSRETIHNDKHPMDYPLHNKVGGPDKFRCDIQYVPFKGHSQRLGQLFRNLYHAVKFMVDSDLDENDKHGYLTILRAQLTNQEQLLLYYNAVSEMGANWINKGYTTHYRMIHNMPVDLVDIGIPPRERFSKEIGELKEKGKSLFEQDETRSL